MKVAINCCFGGFSLSHKAEALYAKRKYGLTLYFYKQIKYKHDGHIPEYEQINPDESTGRLFTNVYTRDFGPSFKESEVPDYSDYFFYESFYDSETRSDPILIEVIEELGEEEASGSCAALSIVEIPDGVNFEISEYDGKEHIAEKHRTWG